MKYDIRQAAQALISQLKAIDYERLPISKYNKRYIARLKPVLSYYMKIYADCLLKGLESIGSSPEEITLIDYGGGSGFLSILAKQAGIGRVIYIDLNPDSVDTIRILKELVNTGPDIILHGDSDTLADWCSANKVKPQLLIATDLIEKLLTTAPKPRRLTVMVQKEVADRMAEYASDAASLRDQQGDFAQKTQELLNAMHAAAQEQTDYLMNLRAGHDRLQTSMQEYAQWSGRVLEAVHQQADASGADAQKMADAMRDSSRELSQSYTSFVENISGGLSRTMGLFEENMHAVVSLLDGKLESIEKTAKTAQSAYTDKADRLNAGTDGLLSALSQLQRALGDMTRSVQAAGDALDEKADKEG